MRLSKQIIESETAPNDGRGQKFVKDDGCEGLWLRVSAGGKKSFVFEGRVKGTKYRRPVGVWPEISLIEARQRVHDIRREINRGVDPFKAADEAAAAVHAEATFSGLAEEYFKSHAIPGQKAESSITADRRNLANHIPKEWYARRLSTFAREDFENLRHGIRGGDATKEVRGRVRQTGGPIIANRVIALLKTMMNLAIKRGMLRGGNPVAGMDKFKERRRMIAYTSDELSRLSAALADEGLCWQQYFALTLMCATRKSEWLQARWENVDLKEGTVTIPRVKRGENFPLVISLTVEARAIIDSLESRGRSAWLFPSPGGSKSGHMESADVVWARVRERAGVEGRDKTIHLLRHTTASRLASAGVPLPILQKTLNHAGPAMTARYYHLDSSASRDALEKFAPQFGRIVATAELPASVSPDENLEADDDRDESAII